MSPFLRTLLVALFICNTVTFAAQFRMFVAYSDPIGEDAWSRTHELARAAAHRSLVLDGYDIHCTLFQSYSAENMTETFSNILDSGEHVDLIVFTSSEHVQTAVNLTKRYPTQKMMTVATKPTNYTVNIGIKSPEAYYLAGRACGRITKTNSVGLVGLLPSPSSFANANAVYAGLIAENPEATLTLMYTNDFYIPPLERATASYLVSEYGVDCGISQSLYANEQWAKHDDIWVVGVAADYRYDINEKVLFSVMYNWEYFYQTITRSILNGTFQGGRDISRGFDLNVMELTAFSTLATNDFERYVVDHKNTIANETEGVFCGEAITRQFQRTSNTTCMSFMEARAMRSYLAGLNNPRNLTLADIQERIYVRYGDPLGVAVLILNGLVMLLSIAMIINTIVYRKTVVIRSSAYIFCIIVLIGTITGALSSYFWLGEPTDAFCMLRAWLGGIGFSISFGGLIVKNYRIWRIFSVRTLDTKGVADSDRALILKGILPMFALEVVILILWTAIDPLRMVEITDSPFLTENQLYIACKSIDVWPVVIFFVPKGILLIGGTVVSYKTRDIKSQFKQYKESKEIGWCIMITVLFAVFVLLVNFMVSYNLLAEVGAFTIAIFAVTASLLGFVFGPKVWRLNIKGDKKVNARSTTNMSNGTSSTRNTVNSHGRTLHESTKSEEMQAENEP